MRIGNLFLGAKSRMPLYISIFENADGGDRVYSKNSNTNQYGPYLITLREQNVFAYRMVTETSCFGVGVINCTSGITESWVPVD